MKEPRHIMLTKKSDWSGKAASMRLPITWDEYDAGMKRCWSAGQGGTEHIQDVFPQLNDDQREFIKTGITPAEWEEMFK